MSLEQSYEDWHNHPKHKYMHWVLFLFVAFFVTQYVVGEIKLFRFTEPELDFTTTQAASGKTLLTPSDIVLVGHYDLKLNSSGSGRGQGLTHRYVNGELRFIRKENSGRLVEFSVTGKSLGSTITSATNYWTNVPCQLTFHNFWFNEADNRMWSLSGNNYDATPIRIQLCTYELHPTDHTINNLHGPVGLDGYYAKRVFGGIIRTPQWFKDMYNARDFMIWGGGGTSLMAQGGGSALGSTMFNIPHPQGFASNSDIPAGQYTVVQNQYTGNSSAYGSGWGTSYDRGARIPGRVENYFDSPNDPRPNPIVLSGTANTNGTTVTWLSGNFGNGNFSHSGLDAYSGAPTGESWWRGREITIGGQNYTIASITDATHLELTTSAGIQNNVSFKGPSTRPVDPPGSNWKDPAPDGLGRLTWSDHYGGAGAWIDGTQKHGFIKMLAAGCGKVWYAMGGLIYDDRCFEWHVFDPDELGAVMQGSKKPFQVQPKHMAPVDLSGDNSLMTGESSSIGVFHNSGMTCDQTVTPIRCYVAVQFHPDGTTSRLYVYDVYAGSGIPPSPSPTPTPPAPAPAPAPSPTPTPAPTVNISVSPTSIVSGGSATLSWSSTNATSCVSSGTWDANNRALSGSQTVRPSQTATYTLTCSGSGGSVTKSAVLTVGVSTPPLAGDLNTDGIVNSIDWSIMNAEWFTSDPTADINDDGIVNSIDFSILNNNWLKTQ